MQLKKQTNKQTIAHNCLRGEYHRGRYQNAATTKKEQKNRTNKGLRTIVIKENIITKGINMFTIKMIIISKYSLDQNPIAGGDPVQSGIPCFSLL